MSPTLRSHLQPPKNDYPQHTLTLLADIEERISDPDLTEIPTQQIKDILSTVELARKEILNISTTHPTPKTPQCLKTIRRIKLKLTKRARLTPQNRQKTN